MFSNFVMLNYDILVCFNVYNSSYDLYYYVYTPRVLKSFLVCPRYLTKCLETPSGQLLLMM